MKQVTAYVHTHWDREWYREFDEFRLRLIEVFDAVLEMLANGDLPCFYFDGQTAALEDYLEIRSEKLPLIKKLIKAKKLRIGPFYCSSDSFLVSGRCLMKNLELGIKKSKELGETDFIGYIADSFGHSKDIPVLLKHFNIDKSCLWRGLGDLQADLDWNGIKVTNLIQGYFQDFLNLDKPIEEKAQMLKKYLDKIAIKSGENVLLPIGADHLAAAKNIKEQIKELNKIYKDYKITLATPFEYFEKIQKRQKVKGEFLENFLNFILPGVYSTRLYIKQANAHSQHILSDIAEPLEQIARKYFKVKDRSAEINYAYKLLIQNQAHDSIYGCSLDSVCDEVMERFKKVDTTANGIIKRTIRDLSDNNAPLAVINLSKYHYTGAVKVITDKKLDYSKIASYKGFTDEKLYNINQIPITEDYTTLYEYLIDVKNLPALSLTHIDKKYICKEKYLKTGKNFIENKNIKFEVKQGKITVTDKQTNTTYNDFITITDLADIGDSYNFGALKNDKPVKAKLKSAKLKTQNPVFASMNLIYEIGIPQKSTLKGRSKKTYKHKINIDVILYNQAKHLEFKANWINKSKDHILKLGFNLKEKIYSTINEDLFSTVERHYNPYFDINKYLPAPRGKEIKPNTFPMQRFMMTQGFGLITKGLNEYEIIKNTINLTLLRAAGIISNPHNPTRGTPAGPPIETPKMQCLGENKANFAITFTNSKEQMYALADTFYECCLTLNTNRPDTKF